MASLSWDVFLHWEEDNHLGGLKSVKKKKNKNLIEKWDILS